MGEIKKKSVDIIIPIYNALEDLVKCIGNVVEYTDLNIHRLILIDDNSTDENVDIYLEAINKKGIYKYKNDINLGFSGTVNKGMRLSDERDVVLLNSDTMVTSGWLDKLIKCAYSDEGIATASPLSNNASICSVPYSNKDNKIPDNMTLDEYAAEIERVSFRAYPTIPMSVGFCMYIKRSVIKEVGFFDSEAFGLGYGEENDFCNRATELGYRHVLCDTTFVYHKGTASFDGDSKEELSRLHESVLEKRYPQLNRKLEWYWAYNQESVVHRNIELFSKLSLGNDKKNIFYLIQADFQEGCSNNIGGTQLHVKDLKNGLKEEYNIFVAARDGEYLRITAYIADRVVSLKYLIGPIPEWYIYRDEKIAKLYDILLNAFKIDLVHIHHTMGMTLELYYVANRSNIPIYLTLHDYYYICPTLRLLDTHKKSCIGKVDWENCHLCMKKIFEIYENVDYMQKWRKEHAKAMALCDKIITPTKSAANVIIKYYPEIADHLEIVEHGIDDTIFYHVTREENYNHKHLHVAFVGGICETKGSEVIYKLISQCTAEFKWYIFGGIDSLELQQLEQKNLKKTGWYKREELKTLLDEHEIDIVCILSTVAETYCYTLSEVIACGVPAVVTDIGALGERMRKMDCGWLVPVDADCFDIINLLKYIKENPLLYEEKRKKISENTVDSIDGMVYNYKEIYNKVKKRLYHEPIDFKLILDGFLSETKDESKIMSSEELISRIKYLENELKIVYDSEIFKLFKKVAKVVDIIKGTLKH